jgi:hypothetical protein
MLHPRIVGEMLDSEIRVARSRLAGRFTKLRRSGTTVICEFGTERKYRLVLNGREYDSEALRLAFVNEKGLPLPGSEWPPGLCHGDHPVLGVPWACVNGTYEYTRFPGHHEQSWDSVRYEIRLPDLLDHLLRKCGH